MSALLPLEDALERMLASALPLPDIREVDLQEALGGVLASDVVSPIDVPSFANSAMDGYALRAADGQRPLRVAQRIPAGVQGEPLAPGTAARIFTGAPLPPGADAVAMQEDCSLVNGELVVSHLVAEGDNVRPCGQDITAGATVLAAGRRLRPQDIGLLASVGLARVELRRPLRVAVLSTGDELVEPGERRPGPGQLYNSNRHTLAALLRSLGMQVIDCGIVPDDPEATSVALGDAARSADCVISSGGVSVGEEDHVRGQVERLGRLDFWKLAIKPGKPLAFGRVLDTPFIGLPGNPTSVFVTFCLVARPFLLKLQGVEEPALPSLVARANFTVKRAATRQDYLRVTLESGPTGLQASRFANQSSGVLSSLSHSNALAVVPVGSTIAVGDSVQVLPLDLLVN
ncbi:MAG: molybdopterin molybdotransferase MoeA [Halioglobus sp.]|nr:molybdopterin molybdotransferase MoeA [Halioglobus sp.]